MHFINPSVAFNTPGIKASHQETQAPTSGAASGTAAARMRANTEMGIKSTLVVSAFLGYRLHL